MRYSSAVRFFPLFFFALLAMMLIPYLTAVHEQMDAQSAYTGLMSLTYELRDSFDETSALAYAYAQTGSQEDLDAYLAKRDASYSREVMLTEMGAFKLDAEEMALLAQIRLCDNDLASYEQAAVAKMRAGDDETALSMIDGSEYRYLRQSVLQAITRFLDAATTRKLLETELAGARVEQAQVLMFTGALLIVLLTVYFVIQSGHVSKSVKELANVASKLCGGDFSASYRGVRVSRELGELADSLSRLAVTAKRVQDDVESLSEKLEAGGVSNIMEHSSFEGGWHDMLDGFCGLIAEVIDVLTGSQPVAFAHIVDGVVADCNQVATDSLSIKNGTRLDSLFLFPEERDELKEMLSENDRVDGIQVHFRSSVFGEQYRRFRVTAIKRPHNSLKILNLWAVDIENEMRRNETVLREQDDLRRIINALPVPLLITDPESTEIIYANKAYLRLFECPARAEIVGFKERNLFLQDEELPAEGKSAEFRYKTHTGKIIDTRVTVRALTYQGKTVQLKIIKDIYEEKRQIQLLQNAAENERESNQLKNRFLISMSHEVRTPMNAIIGLTQLALMRDQTQQNYDSFLKISSSARSLMSVINDILDFSKLEAQKVDLVEVEFNLEDIIANAFLMASSRIEGKHVEMLLDIRPDVPYLLYGDKSRLWRILKSLLDNAAKYTEAGHVVLRVSVKQPITGKAVLRFEVEDTGIGMSEAQLASLFSPFKHGENDLRARGIPGLSMAITKQMVDLMGGQITVSSTLGQGTCCRVELPLQVADAEATIALLLTRYTIRDCKVLVVDDDLTSCSIMEKLLGQLGLVPVCAHTGKEALDLISSNLESGEPFNLIITDYMLCDTTGMELAKKLRFLCPSAKLIMVSAYTHNLTDQEFKLLGFADVMQKPLVPSLFVRSLCDVLEDNMTLFRLSLDTFEGANVLLVEDNAVNQEVGVEMLKMLGIDPVVANNGKEALELLEKQDFHVVLMDVLMPVMDGVETTKAIRNSGNKIPILAMTASIMPDQISEYLKAGMNGHVGKPLEFDTLSLELSRVLPQNLRRSGTHVADYVQASFDIEDIDVSGALARFGGDETRYKEALYKFTEDLESIREYSETLADRDNALRRYHTIVSVAANLGATKLARMMRDSVSDIIDRNPESKSYVAMRKGAAALVERIKAVIEPAEK